MNTEKRKLLNRLERLDAEAARAGGYVVPCADKDEARKQMHAFIQQAKETHSAQRQR